MQDYRKRVISAFAVGTLAFACGFTALQAAPSKASLKTDVSSLTGLSLTAGSTALTSVNLASYASLVAEASPVAAASDVAVSGAFDPSVYGYTNLGIVKVSEGNVNIRKAADASSSIVGKASDGDAVEIAGQEGDFLAVTSGSVTGYIKAEYVLTGSDALYAAAENVASIATVTGDGVNVRAGADTASEILGNVAKDTKLDFLGTEGDFTKVDFAGQDGYISSRYVSVADQLPTASSISEIRYGSGVSNVRADLVNFALQYVGNRYVWGGTSLTNGVDCSGFTMKVYARYGISLPHSSAAQSRIGTKVSLAEAQPGDLVFYGKRRVHHVAIYIGNGQIVHAASKRSGIKISNVNYSTPARIMRILP